MSYAQIQLKIFKDLSSTDISNYYKVLNIPIPNKVIPIYRQKVEDELYSKIRNDVIREFPNIKYLSPIWICNCGNIVSLVNHFNYEELQYGPNIDIECCQECELPVLCIKCRDNKYCSKCIEYFNQNSFKEYDSRAYDYSEYTEEQYFDKKLI